MMLWTSSRGRGEIPEAGRWKTAYGFAALILSSIPLVFAGTPPDPLWQKALMIAQSNASWVAGLVITRSEVVYKGETNGAHETWQRSSLGKDGQVTNRTVKVLEDGKDVTAQEKKKEKGKTKKAAGGGTGNPFSAEVQDRLFLVVTNRTRTIAEKNCVGYLFEIRNTNSPRAQGVAWLEKETGFPVELENVTIDPLPDKRVKGMKITTRYESTPEGIWRVREMRMVGKVSMFFINAEVQSTTRFDEYWQKPARQEDEGKDER